MRNENVKIIGAAGNCLLPKANNRMGFLGLKKTRTNDVPGQPSAQAAHGAKIAHAEENALN